MINFEKVKKMIDRVPVISFDLFDTLVKRDCCKPTELFAFLEQKINQKYKVKSHFAAKRVQAEIDARKNSTLEEVTLDEIYEELSFDEKSVSMVQVRQWEEEYEYMTCQWNPFMKLVYEYCRSQGKQIIIVTDIYLPENLIKRILQKLNIQYDNLFVSSTFRKMKRNGTLFNEVLKQTDVQPSDILHIGDNKRSDYSVPRKLGLHAAHISKDTKLNLLIDHKLCKKNTQYADLCSFINNHANTHSWDAINRDTSFDFFSEVGYEAQGPVLYGYINWLQDQFKKDNIEKVFFLARDGQLMQKAYQKLSSPIVNEYMYASRKALIIPSLWMDPSIQGIQEAISWGKYGTISNFLKKIGLTPDKFKDEYIKSGFSMRNSYKYERLWRDQSFLSVYEKYVKQVMISHSQEAYILMLKYLRQLNFSGRIAVVDIGWFGHMQGALEKIVKEAHIPVEIYGYYLGLRSKSPILNHIQAKGYLFDKDHQELEPKENSFNAIVELFFTADHGTTMGYAEKNGTIVPVLGEWEYSEFSYKEDFKVIHDCQTGALAFVDDMTAAKNYFPLNLNPVIVFANWLKLGIYPSSLIAESLGNLHFMDDSVQCLAKPERSLRSYFFKPYLLLKDFKNAMWRRGFLIRVVGDRFPFAEMYDMAKKIYHTFSKE